MIVNNSYLITEELLPTLELGSIIFNPETEEFFMVSETGKLIKINPTEAEKLIEEIKKGGTVTIAESTDFPTAIEIAADTIIVNNEEITIKEDTVGDGVFTVVDGTLTLEGKGTINGVGKNDYNMAIWAKENGKVIINDGYFTNEGATATVDPEHFDLIYASGNAKVEINGGEFKCQTPKWTLNLKDKDRKTASIVVKGGKFHGFNPADCLTEGEGTNFVAEGYKVVEENGVFTVMPE